MWRSTVQLIPKQQVASQERSLQESRLRLSDALVNLPNYEKGRSQIICQSRDCRATIKFGSSDILSIAC
jgi:hypothetical protein